ncbi:MAG: hypothetical protein IT334_00340 [Thermomicrobiales bacterium]|nr:hypothetical protein [Thermomicrobiales bacterium]
MADGAGTTDHDLDALRAKMRELESFDAVIAESVRRTRALLEEAAELRDRARRELADARAAIEQDRAALDRDRAELTAIARRILGETAPIETPAVLAPPVAPARTPAPSTETSQPNTIIVHGVSRPAVATSLRAHLMAQPGVTAVDPREFAEGILRLQVVASVLVAEPLFTGWKEGEGLTVIQQSPNVVEVVLPGA